MKRLKPNKSIGKNEIQEMHSIKRSEISDKSQLNKTVKDKFIEQLTHRIDLNKFWKLEYDVINMYSKKLVDKMFILGGNKLEKTKEIFKSFIKIIHIINDYPNICKSVKK